MTRARRVAWWVSLVGAMAFGCDGETMNDGGVVTGDAGNRTDSGMVGMDSGMPGEDGAVPGDDAGGGTDAGPPDPTCTDGVMGGAETDVDCGGDVCGPCADGEMCAVGTDCTSGTCTAGTCAAGASCRDTIRNQDETDVDCGGAVCDGCADGLACATGTDCASGICDPTSLTCVTPGCTDGVRNGSETDVDCGGSCSPCADGLGCAVGADCVSTFCDPTTNTCASPSCTDSAQNQDETDVDCGGATCPGCVDAEGCLIDRDCASGVCDPTTLLCTTPSCTDGAQNGDETGIDCGGGTCPTCSTGGGCDDGADCASGVCVPATRTCAAASCTDRVQNGAETGVDCGGGCTGCAAGGACTIGTDCRSGVCTGMTCRGATCTDGVENGAETDVDCGGGTCSNCSAGEGCDDGGDCDTGVCDATTSTCSTAGCMDGVRNGAELGVDCGGGTCPGCADGSPCGADVDCSSGSCDPTTMTCDMPSCTDGARNGAESDVDCGGATCPACGPGEDCTAGSDCSSGICGGGSMTCNAPTCSDGVLNGTETDIDCGGSGCSACDPGDTCRRGSDCTSGACDPATRRCLAGSCGNGIVEGGETCDDNWRNISGATGAGGDGCSVTCQQEPGFSCAGTPSVCTFVVSSTTAATGIPDGMGDCLIQVGEPGPAVVGATSTVSCRMAAITQVGTTLTHPWMGDIEVVLVTPAGTRVTVVQRPGNGSCGSSDDLAGGYTFRDDDDAGPFYPRLFEGGNPASTALTYSPTADDPGGTNDPRVNFTSVSGQDSVGAWSLEVFDRAAADVGTVANLAVTVACQAN